MIVLQSHVCQDARPPYTSLLPRVDTKDRVYTTHLLRRSYRENGKVKNETVGNLSHLPDSVVELVRLALGGKTLVPAEEALQVLRSRPHGHVAAVLGTVKALGLERLLDSRHSVQRDRSVALIVSPGAVSGLEAGHGAGVGCRECDVHPGRGTRP